MLSAEEVLELIAQHKLSIIHHPATDKFIIGQTEDDFYADITSGIVEGYINQIVVTNDLPAGVAQWVEDYAQ